MPSLNGVRIAVLVLGLASASAFAAAGGASSGSGAEAGPAPIQVAQMVPPGGGRPGPMSEAERAKLHQQMLERMVDQSDLTANEKAAAKQTLKAKEEARSALQAELTRLRRVADKSAPTDQELGDALAAYRAAMAQYRKTVEAQDLALVKQISLHGQARCILLGILDNGIGLAGPMPPRGGPEGGDRSQFGPPGFPPPH
jgi:hypothetical protein